MKIKIKNSDAFGTYVRDRGSDYLEINHTKLGEAFKNYLNEGTELKLTCTDPNYIELVDTITWQEYLKVKTLDFFRKEMIEILEDLSPSKEEGWNECVLERFISLRNGLNKIMNRSIKEWSKRCEKFKGNQENIS